MFIHAKKSEAQPYNDKNDTISALIFYHAADYFVYQGSITGFQYELLQQLGKDLQRPIKISVETDPNEAFSVSLTGKYDIVCMDYDKRIFSPQFITRSEPNSYTYPVLLMRKGTPTNDNRKHVIHLSGKYYNSIDLKILNNPQNWVLEKHMDATAEDLVSQLEDSLIDFVVCNYNVAITMLPFYNGLTLGPRMGDIVTRTWILNDNRTELNDTINQWLVRFKKTGNYQELCKKYLSRHSAVLRKSFGTKHRYEITAYDAFLRDVCARHHIDWRFVSSIIYQESRFSSDVLGLGGSYGIMQLMPNTYRQYGMSDTAGVDEQIRTGVKHIAALYQQFSTAVDSAEIYYFVAAAYNAGMGHIRDARALCKKYGGNSQQWASVSQYLKLKSQKKYYSDPAVKYGYYPGKHTVNYVNEVMNRYYGYLITKKNDENTDCRPRRP